MGRMADVRAALGDRVKDVWEAYWKSNASTTDLGAIFEIEDSVHGYLHQVVGPAFFKDIVCATCKTGIAVVSRSHRDNARATPELVFCDPCHKKRQEETSRRFLAEAAEREASARARADEERVRKFKERLAGATEDDEEEDDGSFFLAPPKKPATRRAELKRMPYADYLRTVEWEVTRRAALRRADFKCQINDQHEGPLHVHHRSYARRGDEADIDLFVLCEECHALFHGRLRNNSKSPREK